MSETPAPQSDNNASLVGDINRHHLFQPKNTAIAELFSLLSVLPESEIAQLAVVLSSYTLTVELKLSGTNHEQ
ncbi:MAG: hypothetical protein V7K32_27165 [Nostoc sp.]|uniref:hypothetical protein n=1 Tax=Nostoc sp. TaxID=1180 RepID=UPI002FFCAAF1